MATESARTEQFPCMHRRFIFLVTGYTADLRNHTRRCYSNLRSSSFNSFVQCASSR